MFEKNVVAVLFSLIFPRRFCELLFLCHIRFFMFACILYQNNGLHLLILLLGGLACWVPFRKVKL